MFAEVAAEAAAKDTLAFCEPEACVSVLIAHTTTSFGLTPSPCATAITFLPETMLPERKAARINADVIAFAEMWLLWITAPFPNAGTYADMFVPREDISFVVKCY